MSEQQQSQNSNKKSNVDRLKEIVGGTFTAASASAFTEALEELKQQKAAENKAKAKELITKALTIESELRKIKQEFDKNTAKFDKELGKLLKDIEKMQHSGVAPTTEESTEDAAEDS